MTTPIEQLTSDFIAAVNGAVCKNAGDTYPWCGGELSRRADSHLIFTLGGSSYDCNSYINFPMKFASDVGYPVKRAWAEQYGVDVANFPMQNANSAYLNAVIESAQPNASYTLGGNGSVTAVLHFNAAGQPSTVDYDGQTTSWQEFQTTNWFLSLTGHKV